MAKKPKKQIRPSRLSLDSRVFVKARGEKDEAVVSNILIALKKFDFYDRPDLVRAVAKNEMLPPSFQPFYPTGRPFHDAIQIDQFISRKSYPQWILGLFLRHASFLKGFLESKTALHAKVLRGNMPDAISILDKITQKSESWWGIELRIHIHKELAGLDTKAHIKGLQDLHPHLKVARKAREYLLLSESESGGLYLDTVWGRLKEYQSSSIVDASLDGAAESCQLLPRYFDSMRQPSLQSLHRYANWSIIDQYLLFRAIVMENCGGQNDLELADILELVESVGDWELKNILVDEPGLDMRVSEVLELYTNGDYRSVINLVAGLVEEESRQAFGLLEVYARAKIYTSTVGVDATYFDKLATEFARILMLDSKSTERARTLRKICIKFRGEAWAKSLLFHVASIQEWQNEDSPIEIARLQTLCLGVLNTPKARGRQVAIDDFKVERRALIPRYRVLRYAKDITSSTAVDSSIFPIYSDYLKTQSRYLIEAESTNAAIRFCIDEYLKNNVSFDYLPIRLLAEKVEALIKNDGVDFISGLLIYHIYARECSVEFDEQKSALFEDFLEFNATHQPSTLFTPDQLDLKTTYFLRHICVPTQLDNIIQFTSYDEVIHERVAIIDLLISAKSVNVKDLRSERDRVLETLFSEKLRAKLETGKLFVDVQALENDKRHVYSNLYQKAKSLAGGAELDPISEFSKGIDSVDIAELVAPSSPVPLALASSEKSSILLKIFMQLVADFALNENYGLDKYLSAEIRHVVFESQLRSCFEKCELITVQKDGEYLPNEFWAEKYNYVPTNLLSQLDVELSIFSRTVDNILADVNERFRIKSRDPSLNHIFDFGAYHHRIVRISRIVEQAVTFDEFFKLAIAFMWELAVESARAAQQLINDVLLVDVVSAIDEVEIEINELKGSFGMVDLMEAIKKGRTDFKNEVELVLNWFRFVGSEDVQSFERLSVVIEAAVSSFETMFKHKGRALISHPLRSEILLNYSEARALFISLFTALENALRYSAADTPVEIVHESGSSSDQVVISNVIAAPILDSDRIVREAKAKWTSEFSKLSTAEGGSGLYKIFNLLNNASMGFNFDIYIRSGKFCSAMEVKHEYFDHRRQLS